MIFLEILRGFPLKSSTFLSPMNPPKIPVNSAGNLWEIPEEFMWKIPLNFGVDPCFTYSPNYPVDSTPPSIRHPRGFPTKSTWFCPLGDKRWWFQTMTMQLSTLICQRSVGLTAKWRPDSDSPPLKYVLKCVMWSTRSNLAEKFDLNHRWKVTEIIRTFSQHWIRSCALFLNKMVFLIWFSIPNFECFKSIVRN